MELSHSKQHWENVYNTKQLSEVSWYQPVPQASIELLLQGNVKKNGHIIDVGCGDSFFIDYLVQQEYKNIYALDISVTALERMKARLEEKASQVHFIANSVLEFKPEVQYDFWHDRAAFHFLTNEKDIQAYVDLVTHSIVNGGTLAIGTFSLSGPTKCSGLNVRQYSTQSLSTPFSQSFIPVNCYPVEHKTPFGTVQNFTFCLFRKKNTV